MADIREHTDVIRSKNAGPYDITLDIIFSERGDYERVRDEELITPQTVAERYGIPADDVRVFAYYDPAKAIKITIDRPTPAGGRGERDVLGAQQYAPLLNIDLPLD